MYVFDVFVTTVHVDALGGDKCIVQDIGIHLRSPVYVMM